MIDEEEAARLLRNANPIPNVDDNRTQGLVLHESAAALDQAGDQMAAPDGNRKLRRGWAAVAAAVVLAGLAIGYLGQNRNGITVVGTGSTTTTTAVPTTDTTSALSGIPVWLGRGDGQFVPARAAVPFAFTAIGGWNSVAVFNTEDRFTICAPADSPTASGCPLGSVSVIRLDQGDIEATKVFLASIDGAEIADEEPVVIGGAEGIRFTYTHQVRATPGGQFQGDIDAPVAVDYGNEKIPIGSGPLGTGVVSIVDVAGETMVVSYQAEDATRGAPIDGFNTNLRDGLQIIDSIIWADLQ